MYKVFIDGAHGTTGLRINEYLAGRPDIQGHRKAGTADFKEGILTYEFTDIWHKKVQ